MDLERLTASATIAANHHSVVVPLKREERPLSQGGTGTLCRAVQRMTVQEFGNLSLSRGVTPSVILAERVLRLAASGP